MNSKYYETLDENFSHAIDMYEKLYTNSELLDFIKSGNVVQKQIATIRLENIISQDEADILVSNLTGQDGKVREVISSKILEFSCDDKQKLFFLNSNYYSIYLDALIDINGNICRNIIKFIDNLKEDNNFVDIFSSGLIELSGQLLNQIEKFNFQEGKYKVNKEVFKLYWCLEAIYVLYECLDKNMLYNILNRASLIQEYTIREKVAKILSKEFEDSYLLNIKQNLKNDENYYVRRY